MKITLVKTASSPGDMFAFQRFLESTSCPDLVTIVPSIFGYLDRNLDAVTSAALYEIVDAKGTYHVIGFAEVCGVTAMFHTRQMLEPETAKGTVTLPSPSTELDLLMDKARRYDQIISAAGKHALRISAPVLPDSFDTVGELHAFLDAFHLDKDETCDPSHP